MLIRTALVPMLTFGAMAFAAFTAITLRRRQAKPSPLPREIGYVEEASTGRFERGLAAAAQDELAGSPLTGFRPLGLRSEADAVAAAAIHAELIDAAAVLRPASSRSGAEAVAAHEAWFDGAAFVAPGVVVAESPEETMLIEADEIELAELEIDLSELNPVSASADRTDEESPSDGARGKPPAESSSGLVKPR